MLQAEDSRSLPLLYHINSEPWLNLEAYTDPLNEMQFKRVRTETHVDLPRTAAHSKLSRLIRERRSCRAFTGAPLLLAQLACVLEHAYSVTGITDEPGGHRFYSRPVPSAGALYPLEICAATQAIDGLPDGVYHYAALDHRLEPLRQEPVLKNMTELMLGQSFFDQANALLFLTAVFDRTLRKYGPRGYRYILFEAGHVAQNVCLVAAELGLATVCLGGFVDHRLNPWLGLDGTSEAALYAIALGHSK